MSVWIRPLEDEDKPFILDILNFILKPVLQPLRKIASAKKMEIENLLAEISSGNEASLRFHKKMGFQECGRLKRIGRKFDQDFDIVIIQKTL